MIEALCVLLLICLCRRPGSRPAPKAFYTNTIGVPPLSKVPRPPPLPGARRGGGAVRGGEQSNIFGDFGGGR